MRTLLSSLLTLLYFSIFLTISSCKTGQYQIQSRNEEMLTINSSLLADSAIDNYISPYREQLEAAMNEVIGDAPLEMLHNRNLPETELSNFFSDALLAVGRQIDPEVTFSLATKDGIRSSISKGDVTIGSVFSLMPFENLITILELKGSDVMTLGEFIAQSNGQPVGNIKMVIKEKKMVEFLINNQPIDPDKTYKMITYDFIANGGDHVQGLGNPILKFTSQSRVRESLIEYIRELTKEGKKVESHLDGRIKIIQ